MARLLPVGLLGCLLGLGTTAAQAASFPSTTVRIIEPYAPGGGADLMTRVVAQKLNEIWGQAVVVDNRPGAGGSIGAALLAKAPPDGTTLLMSSTGIAVAPTVYKDLSYRVPQDFAAVAMLAYTPQVIVVRSSLPVQSVADLVAYAKANPGKMNFASAGTGTLEDLTSRMFQQRAGIKAAMVAYRGGEPALLDVVAGQADLDFDTPAAVIPYLKQNKLRALAVTSKDRFKLLPDVPTLAEAGYPEFDAVIWNGFFLPAATPKPVIDQVNAAVSQALSDPVVLQRLESIGFEPKPYTPEAFSAFFQDDVVKWSKVARAAGIVPQ